MADEKKWEDSFHAKWIRPINQGEFEKESAHEDSLAAWNDIRHLIQSQNKERQRDTFYNTIIRRLDESNVETYNPFIYYYPKSAQKETKTKKQAILGSSLYLQFVSLDEENPSEIYGFITKYGPIENQNMPFRVFMSEVRTLRALTNIYIAFNRKDKSDMSRSRKELDEVMLVSGQNSQSRKKSESSSSTVEQLGKVINNYIKNISPLLFTDKEDIQWNWGQYTDQSTTSLLSTMYLMFALDITKDTKLERCQNSTCNYYYLVTKPSRRFCSLNCQTAEKQRRHRAKEKLE